jgi:ubiquitin-protein ligase
LCGIAIPVASKQGYSGGGGSLFCCKKSSNLPIYFVIAMMSPRHKRLSLDFERLKSRFSMWPVVQLTAYNGSPPEQYQFTYFVKGLYVAAGGDILEREQHILEVNLSLGYPRRAPQCKMLTPVFHPNFDDSTVCIGDFWAASEGLEDLVIRIGRMLTYQDYNIKSPLNGLAAKWAAENTSLLPVDTREIAPPQRNGEVAEEESTGRRRNMLPPQTNGEGAVQNEDGSWGDRIVINFGESSRFRNNTDKPSTDVAKHETGRVLRVSPGLEVDELKVNCRACGQSMLLGNALFGQAFQCPNCARTHRVADDGV